LVTNQAYAAPRNALEEKLVAIWMDVLNLKQVGIHDDFFVVGRFSAGHAPPVAGAADVGSGSAAAPLFETTTIAGLAGSFKRR